MADNFNISDVPEGVGPKSVEVPGDIADGTDGELMTWDAAGVASLVPVGTITDVLTSNGAGAPPTFQPGGGAAPVDSVFTRVGAVVAVAGDYAASEVSNDSAVAGAFVDDALNALGGAITGLDSTDIANVSGVAGATVTAALNTLDAASAPVDSVFTRTGAVVAATSDYDASQVDNDSNIVGATVDVALNNLDNAALQMRRTTDFAVPTVFGDIELDTIDIETDSNIIDGEAGTPDRVTLEVAGVYEIHYQFNTGPTQDTNSVAIIQGRVRVNDTTVLDGSELHTYTFEDNSIESEIIAGFLSCTFLYDATAADFITLQANMIEQDGSPTPDLLADTIIMTVKRITQPE